MKSEPAALLSRSYLTALRTYLKAGPKASLVSARRLGFRALKSGLETLDLARIHEQAFITLLQPRDSARTLAGLISRAGIFFAEAITPIEQTHRGALEAGSRLKLMLAALNERTLELATSVKDLKLEVAQRKAVEKSLRASELTTRTLLRKARQMQEELRHLSRQLLSAQEAERRKISRELHDVIASTLTGINVRLAALKIESAASTQGLRQKIASTQQLVEKSVEIVHRFARELRPSVLDDLGLIPALQSFMKTFLADTGVRVSLTAFADIEQSDSMLRTVLYRIAQEALTNVARHAHATRAEVSIKKHDGLISMEVKDDGCGFPVNVKSNSKKHNRLGLLGMRERIEMIGGTFSITSSPGHPTIVRVAVAA